MANTTDHSPTWHTEEQPCPWCGALLDSHMDVGALQHGRPQPGDVAVCVHCAEASIVGMLGELRQAPPAALDEAVRRAQAAVRHGHAALDEDG